MKLVLKYGGTSISLAKDIKNICENISSLAKHNSIVVVCSAIDGVTDELLEMSKLIQRGNKKQVDHLLFGIKRKHNQLGDHLITTSQIKESFSKTLSQVTDELEELVHGLILLGEVTPRSLDYLISFGERLSIVIISYTLQEHRMKSSILVKG